MKSSIKKYRNVYGKVILSSLLYCFIIIILISNHNIPLAQVVLKDTIRTDTVVLKDTIRKKSQVEAVVYYKALDSVVYDINLKSMFLYNESEIKYQKIKLASGKISVDFDKATLFAEGISVMDSSDTNKSILIKTPLLNDAGEEYAGKEIEYNFRTQQGSISMAKTAGDGQVYYGSKIKRLNPEVYLVKEGKYTTCDAEHPHFYFFSNEMKVYANEFIIARWIWLYFADVPFPIPLPFGVFPNQSGRRSGIIPPTYGERAGMGRYFSNFGYYWAISDYLDANLTASYYTRGGYALNSNFRYVKRYDFQGSVDLGYSDFSTGEKSDPDYSKQSEYKIAVNHSQEIDPTSRLTANLNFLSSNYYRNTSTNINDLINNQIVSNASYFKTWENSGANISVNYNRIQNLTSGDISEILPGISFSVPQFNPFKRSIKSKSKSSESLEEKWYEQIGVNYSSQFQNRRINQNNIFDTRGGISHDISVYFASRIGYFNISPRLGFNSRWYHKQIEKNSFLSFLGNDSLVVNDIDKISTLQTFDFSLNLNTKFYGMFRPGIFGITALRHTVTPGISYNYRPDFSKPFWNYYKTYKNSKGEDIKYSIFEREIFGGASAGEQQAISFSLSNNFEMKVSPDPSDTTAAQNKIQLLNVDFATSYNFAADSLRFSDIRSNFYTNIGSYFSIGGSAAFSLYKYVQGVGLVNKYLAEDGEGLLRLTNFNISISTSLSSDLFRTKGNNDIKKDTVSSKGIEKSLYEQIKAMEKGVDYSIPWSLSINYSYNLSKFDPQNVQKYSNLGLLLSFSLTKSWKFSVSGNYDIFEKQLSAPVIRISRDLHCWDMNFEWYPVGSYRGFRFIIRAKAPQLQDLKVEKSGGVFSR